MKKSDATIARVSANIMLLIDDPVGNNFNYTNAVGFLEATVDEIRHLGYAFVIYPAVGMTAADAAMESGYAHLRWHGSTVDLQTPLMPVGEMNDLMGFSKVFDFEDQLSE